MMDINGALQQRLETLQQPAAADSTVTALH